jgi:hypothetical protein
MSRQALILSRRQTQHRGSENWLDVSVPHTEHFTFLLSLSAVSERTACSRISGGITGSGLVCGLRLMSSSNAFSE